MLVGGGLAVAGFVSQVVDAASKPVAVPAIAASTNAAENAPVEREPVETSVPAAPSDGLTFAPARTRAKSAADQPARPAPPATTMTSGGGAAANNTKVSSQPVTIGNPDPAREDMRIFLILQYRFEPGHQPQPGRQYDWVVELQGVAHKISFAGETLEKQGQLTHLFDASAEGGGFEKPWATWIEIEVGGEGRQISNRLEIEGDEVRSLPLSAVQ